MSEHGKPNPIIDVLSNTVAALRADEDMHALAKAYNELDPKAIEKLSVDEARQQPSVADAVKRVLQKQGRDTDPAALIPGITREDLHIPTATGGLKAFVYRPENSSNAPLIVYYHGGGWVIADAEVYDASARGLAKRTCAIVVSVEYRRAPEHKFPAAWDDALAAYAWVAENAVQLGADPSRLALAGESAGATLALATAVAARDAGLPAPRHVLAIYPVAQTGSLHTESYLENAIAKPLNRAMIEWFTAHVVRTDEDRHDTRLDLEHADLHGLPPVTVINASLDPLRSDGGILQQALQDAGVPVEREIYSGVAHEFFGTAAVVHKASEAQAYAAKRLRLSLFL